MSNKKQTVIHLLSCRTREMNTDLLPVFEAFSQESEFCLQTFTRDAEKNAAYDPIAYDLYPSDNTGHSIVNDIAMKKFIPELKKENRQVLLATVNNYYFQLAINDQPLTSAEKKERLRKFSHVYAPNKLIYDIMREHLHKHFHQKIKIMQTPFIYNLNKPEMAEKKHDEFLMHFPMAKDKKIFFIMLTNQVKESCKENWSVFPLHAFLEELGKDWIIVTNAMPVLQEADTLPKDYANRILYVNRQLPLEDILYYSDALITNLPFFAAAQAGKNKPFYCLCHNDSPFELYMKKNHPKLYLNAPDDLLKQEITKGELTPLHHDFYDIFTCKDSTDPVEDLRKLF